jgi:lipoprotein-anchoring transpeptidase ErfK/SrfK
MHYSTDRFYRPSRSSPPPVRRSRRKLWLIGGLAVIVVSVAAGGSYRHLQAARPVARSQKSRALSSVAAAASPSPSSKPTTAPSTTPAAPKLAVKPIPSQCADNSLSKLALVSISQRRLWACAGTTVAYTSAVVTGMENLPADLTPVGTYHVYGKQSNLYLNGSDSTGSWHDYVYYWMPFLDNQYGAYGFHDATWRAASAFGNISPYSSSASHGCVELPLATAKWLYNWVNIGTAVTVES